MKKHQYIGNIYNEDDIRSFDEFAERTRSHHRVPGMISDHELRNFHGSYQQQQHYHHDAPEHENNQHWQHRRHDAPEHGNHQHRRHHQDAPEVVKKVYFVEKVAEVDRDGNTEVYKEETIDIEADGFIQQRHKNFELSKLDTFKVR